MSGESPVVIFVDDDDDDDLLARGDGGVTRAEMTLLCVLPDESSAISSCCSMAVSDVQFAILFDSIRFAE